MTGGQSVVAQALRHLGVTEQPWGSNRGPYISEIQREAGRELGTDYTGAPWCAIAVRDWYKDAGLPHEWIHPYTGYICDHARREGWISTGYAPPGALIIRCGVHVEIVERDPMNGTLEGIGGNVNHGVRRTVRDRDDWQIIVPPFIGRTNVPATERRYWFDDLDARPTLYGGWRLRDDRERVIAGLRSDLRARVRRVNKGGKAPFAFEVIEIGAPTWRFGPWADVDDRDEQLKRYRKAHPKHRTRKWSETQIRRPGAVTEGSVD